MPHARRGGASGHGRPRSTAAGWTSRPGADPGRDANDADAVDVRDARARARPSRGGARLPGRPRHAHADVRRAADAHLGRTVVDGRAGDRQIFNHRWDDPATFLQTRDDSRARDRRPDRRPTQSGCAGRPQPARHRIRSRPHLRPRIPPRSGRFLRGHEIPLSGHRRTGNHPLHALARRPDHQLRGDRDDRYAGPGGDQSRRGSAPDAGLAPGCRRDARWRGRRVLRRRARGVASGGVCSRLAGTSSGSTSRSTGCWR